MRTRNMLKGIGRGVFFFAAVSLAISCGGNGAANNYQGMSVTLL